MLSNGPHGTTRQETPVFPPPAPLEFLPGGVLLLDHLAIEKLPISALLSQGKFGNIHLTVLR